MFPARLRPAHAALVAALAAAAVALPSVRNGFVEDDHWVVEQRPLLQQRPSFGAVLREPYWPKEFGGGLWRPAVLATYALDYRVSASPRWFHAVNVLWAAAAAAVLGFLAAAFFGPVIGLAAGLLFAVHPVHVEATTNVVGRAELMAAAGYGLALVFSLRASQDRRYLAAVALAAALAIGSKEHATTLPIAVLLVYAARAAAVRGDVRASFRAALPSMICATIPIVLYFLIRPAVTGGAFASGGLAPGLKGHGLPARAWAMLAVSLEWWRLLFVPVHLSADYSPAELVVTTALTARHVFAIGLWLAAGWLAWRLRHQAPGVILGLAWIVVTLVPVSNILIPTEIVLAERTLYLPSFGAAVALAGLGAALPWPRALKSGGLALFVLAGAARSVARADVWRDEARWAAALERDAPRSYRVLWMEGKRAFAEQRWGTGERLLREAIAAAPDVPGPREDLVAYYGAAGRWRPAALLLRESIDRDPLRPRPWVLLPRALFNAGDTVAAVQMADSAAHRFPQDFQVVWGSLGVLVAAKRCDTARALADSLRQRLAPAELDRVTPGLTRLLSLCH